MYSALTAWNNLDGPDSFPKRKPISTFQLRVATACSSEQFKTGDDRHKPLANEWHGYFNAESGRRMGSSSKDIIKYLQDPSVISLGGGIPSGECIPFDEIAFRPTPLIKSDLRKETTISTLKTTLHSTGEDIIKGKSIYDLSIALNYGQGCGSPQLLRWIIEHTEMVHAPPYVDWQCSMTIGNTSALYMCLRMLTKDCDCILTDKYTFSTAIKMAIPMELKFVGIEMDHEGMSPSILDETLIFWNSKTSGNLRRPSLLYLIPTGQNPTGTTRSLQRRRDIYKVAQKHDLCILEDDPYYFLQMNKYKPSNPTDLMSGFNSIRPLGDLYKKLIPSYLSMDIDGRVIRMDSFSKIIGPGARLGWITACKQVVDHYRYHTDVLTQSPSGLSQLALFKLLEDYWGHDGFTNWLTQLRDTYTKRRNAFLAACERHLPADVVSREPTYAGMFQWFKINWETPPNALEKCLTDLEQEIWLEIISAGTLVSTGSLFRAPIYEGSTGVFYRATFAAAPLEKIEEAIKRFGNAPRRSFQIEGGTVASGFRASADDARQH